MKKIIIAILMMFLLTGCYNYKELNDLGIVSAIGISKENDEFTLDVQLVNIVEAGKNGISEAPISVITGKGKTIFEAARSLNLKSSKTFFISNLEYVLLDKSILKSDMNEVIDYLTRDARLPLNFLIVTTLDDKPKDIMSALSQFDINSASNLSKTLKLSENRYGESYSLTMKELLGKYLSNFSVIVYPNIKLVGDAKKLSNTENLKESNSNNYVSIEGLVFFNKDKEEVLLSKDEAFGYNFLVNHITNATITTKCDGGYFTVEILKSKFGYDNLKNDELTIKGKVEAEIVYYGCEENLSEEKSTEKITDILNNEIERYIKDTIKLAQEEESDFLEVGSFIYKNNTKYFDFKNKDWNKDKFPNLKFKYDIKTNIVKQGNLRGDIHE